MIVDLNITPLDTRGRENEAIVEIFALLSGLVISLTDPRDRVWLAKLLIDAALKFDADVRVVLQ